MRLGPDPRRRLRRADLCRNLGSAPLSGMPLEARYLRPLEDDLPVGFKTSNRPAGSSPSWPIEPHQLTSGDEIRRGVGDELRRAFHLEDTHVALGGLDRFLQGDHVDRLIGKGTEILAQILEIGDARPFGDLVDCAADGQVLHRAFRDVELIQMWKAESTASSAVAFGAADWL